MQTAKGGLGTCTVRPLKPSDFDQMEELLATRDELDERGAQQRMQLMQWLALRNPCAEGAPTYFVAEDNGRVVAFHGRMPVYFSLRGKRTRGYYVHDLYVHPEYREKGLGFWLTMALAKEIEEKTDSFFCLVGMTDLNRMMQKRRKYHEQFSDLYIRPLGFRNEVVRNWGDGIHSKVASFLPRVTLALLDLFLLRESGTIAIRQADRFDATFDSFFEQLSPKLGVCAWKGSAYLNWRYVDRPFRREVVFTAEENGTMAGFMVLSDSPYRKRFRRGVIVDLVADPDRQDVISALVRYALRYFRKSGVDSVGVTFTDDRFAKALKPLLFMRGTGGKMVMMGNLNHVPSAKDLLSDIKNWHMTFAESDGYMLSP